MTLAQAADGMPIVEVAHEQLLRRWPRLKSWLDDEREFLVWKGAVEHDAAQPEPDLLTGRRRRRVAFFAVSAALAVFVVLSAFAGWKWYDANAQRKLAEAQREHAKHSLALATQTAG